MSVTLVDRTREIIAAENDDYFQDDTILFYLNKAQDLITSIAIKKEMDSRRSLRCLDLLRKKTVTAIGPSTSYSVTAKSDYYTTVIPLPNLTDYNDMLSIRYDEKTHLKEISSGSFYRLDWGTLKPTIAEGYYSLANLGTETEIELFIHESPLVSTDVTMYYFVNADDIVLLSETLPSFPVNLEDAVIFNAAYMMAIQSGRPNVQMYFDTFKMQLDTNIN